MRNRLGNSPTEIRLARKMVLFDIFGALAPWIGEGVKERTEINSKTQSEGIGDDFMFCFLFILLSLASKLSLFQL